MISCIVYTITLWFVAERRREKCEKEHDKRERSEKWSRFDFVMKNRDDREKERKVTALVFLMCIIMFGLSNICDIVHVKTINSSNFFLKNNNYLFKSFIFNIKCTSSNIKFLF